jgi:hypothetical protein
VAAHTAVQTPRHRPSAWGWLVTGCAVLVGGALLALLIWFLASRETTVATYSVQGSVSGIVLDIGAADVEIVGGGDHPAVEVRRTDRFSFGHKALAERRASDGTFEIRSRCPKTLLSACDASYRLAVPDNVGVTVRTTSGDVRFTGYRGSAQVDTDTGNIAINGFCGFGLRARSQSGAVTAGASCALARMELRSRTGDVVATVPPGRYQIDADTDVGRRSVRGVTEAEDAPFQIQALSSAGDVTVEAGE